MAVCATEWPPTVAVGPARRSECWLHKREELSAEQAKPLEREVLAVAEEA
jgi:hypothetical protein